MCKVYLYLRYHTMNFIFVIYILHGRHVIIWYNMKTMRHEVYVPFTSICIFLVFARSIICFSKTFFAKRCRNQMCKHSLPLWLKLNNAVNIRIVYIYWFYFIAHFFEIPLPIKYVLSVLTLKYIQNL